MFYKKLPIRRIKLKRTEAGDEGEEESKTDQSQAF